MVSLKGLAQEHYMMCRTQDHSEAIWGLALWSLRSYMYYDARHYDKSI